MAVAAFDTDVSGSVPGVTVSQQDDASLANASFGQLVKDFNGQANIIKLWVAGFPPMERRQAAYQQLLKQHPGIHELESIGAVSSDVQGDTANKVGAVLAKYPKARLTPSGALGCLYPGRLQGAEENGRTEIKLYSIDISNQDLQLMREAGSPWQVSVAVDRSLSAQSTCAWWLTRSPGKHAGQLSVQSDGHSASAAAGAAGAGQRRRAGEDHPRLGQQQRFRPAVVRHAAGRTR
ncbi:hypothetical protein M8494_17475 [Serratia ureilytica]